MKDMIEAALFGHLDGKDVIEMKQLKYYIFVIQWLWKNRSWQDSRQKFKQMNKEWEKKNEK
jgi:hypothetical protein